MRAKCRSVYAFRQVWRFMQESRGRFNPWEPLCPLPTILWPSRFRAALTRRNLAPAKPYGTLPHRPAAIRVVWIARHTVHTAHSATATSDNLREKNYCEIKQPNAAPCPQHGERRVVAPRGSGSETGVHNTGARPLPVGGFGCQAGVRDEM